MKRKERRTYATRREYLIAAVARRRKAVRQKAIAHKGGRGVYEELEEGGGRARQVYPNLRELPSRNSCGNSSFLEQSGLKHRVNSGKPKLLH